MKKLCVILTFRGFIFSHHPLLRQNSFDSKNLIIDTSLYVIIKYNASQRWLFKHSRPASLTRLKVDSIETILLKAALEHNTDITKSNEFIKALRSYKRQYIAVLNKNGQKEVYVNCFCRTSGTWDSKWKKELMVVLDGGSCYFSIKINLTKKSYFDLIVNGS